MTELRSVSFLSAEHAEGFQALSREPDFAAAAGVDVALSLDEARQVIATATEAREEGRSYVFALTKDSVGLLGVCRLIGVLGVPRLIVSIGSAYRGQGNGVFIVRHVLTFAFDTLQLERVTAGGACLRLVARFGQLDGNGLTREAWLAKRLS
jgi:RimJ/RimL family protein N-acetyltransferase